MLPSVAGLEIGHLGDTGEILVSAEDDSKAVRGHGAKVICDARQQAREHLTEVYLAVAAAHCLRRSGVAVIRREAKLEPCGRGRAVGIDRAVERGRCLRQRASRERFHDWADDETFKAAERDSQIVRRHGAKIIGDACRQAREHFAEVCRGEVAAQCLWRRDVLKIRGHLPPLEPRGRGKLGRTGAPIKGSGGGRDVARLQGDGAALIDHQVIGAELAGREGEDSHLVNHSGEKFAVR